MVSLVERIRHGELWDFPGGIHPPENKTQSTQTNIIKASLPSELILPVKQHIGRAGDVIVNVGDTVLKGQQLTHCTTGFMLPVHAPTSGEIIAIEPRRTAHPSGLAESAIIIKPDGEDKWIEKQPIADFKDKSAEQLIEIIRQAGISGMGGAGFPTARKIQSGVAKTEILIINAAECEPYITADDMLMREHAHELIQGIDVLEHILHPKLVIIAVEDNKPEAIKALEAAALNKNLVIRVIPTKYPSGGEKQLIKLLTNKEVPHAGIPAEIGVLVQNVGSVYAIKRAVMDGEPLIERIVTLTGNTFPTPRNIWARLGTPVQALLDEFDYKKEKKYPRIIMGGPMMGFTIPSTDVPITKNTNCILAPTRKEIAPKPAEMACIRCGQCAEACPASLLPQQLFWYSKDKDYDKCEELHLADCIECGACAYVCPSEIPLVEYYRKAKAEIRITKEEAEAAERAKLRFEQRKMRLERDKAERESRFKQAAIDRRKEMKKTGNDDAIAAAIERVKAQKTSQSDTAVKPAVAAAIARAKAKQAEALKSGEKQPDNSEMSKLREERKRQARERKAQQEAEKQETQNATTTAESSTGDKKKDAVAAAIARAKAKKAQQAEKSEPAESIASEESTDEVQDKKKAAVAAAIARAKAKKAQQAEQSEPAESTASEESTDQVQDKKKAAVAAAIARAKAKKAQQAEQSEPAESTASEESTDQVQDKKKAAVAAAVARAKAKKAQSKAQNTAEEQNIEEKE